MEKKAPRPVSKATAAAAASAEAGEDPQLSPLPSRGTITSRVRESRAAHLSLSTPQTPQTQTPQRERHSKTHSQSGGKSNNNSNSKNTTNNNRSSNSAHKNKTGENDNNNNNNNANTPTIKAHESGKDFHSHKKEKSKAGKRKHSHRNNSNVNDKEHLHNSESFFHFVLRFFCGVHPPKRPLDVPLQTGAQKRSVPVRLSAENEQSVLSSVTASEKRRMGESQYSKTFYNFDVMTSGGEEKERERESGKRESEPVVLFDGKEEREEESVRERDSRIVSLASRRSGGVLSSRLLESTHSHADTTHTPLHTSTHTSSYLLTETSLQHTSTHASSPALTGTLNTDTFADCVPTHTSAHTESVAHIATHTERPQSGAQAVSVSGDSSVHTAHTESTQSAGTASDSLTQQTNTSEHTQPIKTHTSTNSPPKPTRTQEPQQQKQRLSDHSNTRSPVLSQSSVHSVQTTPLVYTPPSQPHTETLVQTPPQLTKQQPSSGYKNNRLSSTKALQNEYLMHAQQNKLSTSKVSRDSLPSQQPQSNVDALSPEPSRESDQQEQSTPVRGIDRRSTVRQLVNFYSKQTHADEEAINAHHPLPVPRHTPQKVYGTNKRMSVSKSEDDHSVSSLTSHSQHSEGSSASRIPGLNLRVRIDSPTQYLSHLNEAPMAIVA